MIKKDKAFAFSAVAEDIISISNKIIENEKLCRLLYYNTVDADKKENLTLEQKEELIQKEYVQVIPRIRDSIENEMRNFILISYGNFIPSGNSSYMNGIITIDILCPLDLWKIENRYGDFDLRPYSIAQEIYTGLEGSKLSGIGVVRYVGGDSLILGSNPDYAGLTLNFEVVNSNS